MRSLILPVSFFVSLSFPAAGGAPQAGPVSVKSYSAHYTCGVSSNSKGCKGEGACKAGYRITSVRAACNLERGAPDWSKLDNVPPNMLQVVRSSDNRASCFVDDTRLESGGKASVPLTPSFRPGVRFGCAENEANGGDCRVYVEATCERRDNTPRRPLRMMTLNIHHGRDKEGKSNLTRIAELIRSEDADLVALQEVDMGTRRTQGEKQAKEIASQLGYEYRFEKAIDYDGGEYGNAIVSRFPLYDTDVVRLPPGSAGFAGEGEARIALGLHVIPFWSSPSDDFVFVSAHLGIFDPARLDPNQSETSRRLLAYLDRPNVRSLPLVFAGDLNARFSTLRPLSQPKDDAAVLSNLATKLTFEPYTKEKAGQIDFMLFRGGRAYKAGAWSVVSSSVGISDHSARMFLMTKL